MSMSLKCLFSTNQQLYKMVLSGVHRLEPVGIIHNPDNTVEYIYSPSEKLGEIMANLSIIEYRLTDEFTKEVDDKTLLHAYLVDLLKKQFGDRE